jgi:DNA repair protein RadA/Sms
MAKSRTSFVCGDCGSVASRWTGQCADCKAWNTMTEQVESQGLNRMSQTHIHKSLAQTAPVLSLKDIDATDVPRFGTGIDEFDRVLGGGLVAGGVVLIGGDPGIGKSTLLLQALANLAEARSTLYVSGEESGAQIALRARRLQVEAKDLKLQAEIQLEKILGTIADLKPDVAVIDSIQTLYSDALTSAPGSVSQVRECAAQLTRVAKQTGVTIILVGHVTKEGALAGPRVLEHIVDTVLYFEGDTHTSFRLVRAVKNRFGAVNELGVFAMTDRGLRGVSNPSALFLAGHSREVAGSCVMVTREGTRPLLVEVQALVDASPLSNPRRVVVGLEGNRLAMLLAVLHRHGGVKVGDQDVFVNVVGGIRVQETAADLPVLLAVLSSLRDAPLAEKTIAFGEVGLSGEIRPVPNGEERLKEAATHGFKRAIVPKANAPKSGSYKGMEIVAVERLADALEAAG